MGQRPSAQATLLSCISREDTKDGGKVRVGCLDSRSLCGEDAFYREAWHECVEGNTSHDRLFSAAREQARLKLLKGATFYEYAKFEVQSQAMTCMRPRDALSCSEGGLPLFPDSPRTADDNWLGTTIPQWTETSVPPTGEGPYWAKGTGTGLNMRCGPDYLRRLQKVESNGALYEACGLDIVKSSVRLQNFIGRLVSRLPCRKPSVSDSEAGAGMAPEWKHGCPVPRVLCINLMLPYEPGLNPFSRKEDPGLSVVGFFHIKPETLKALSDKDPPAALKLWRQFCAGPAGEPNGPHDDPSRSLDQRRCGETKNLNLLSGLFKMTAKCENPDDVRCPKSFRQYNGKPCLITKSGYIVRDPQGEWLEIGIDVRKFNPLARKMLCSFRGLLPQTRIHYGFWIQAVDNEEMPEGLLCDVFACGMNIVEHPVVIPDEVDADDEP